MVFLFLLRSVNDVAATRFIDPERTVINERVLIEDVEDDVYSIVDGEEIILSAGEREYFANLDLYRNRTESTCFYCLIEPEPTKEIEFSDVNVEITDYRSGYGTAELKRRESNLAFTKHLRQAR